MSKQELLRQARRLVEQRRQQAETAAMQRKEEIYKAVPDLARMDELRTEAGVLATRLSLSGDKEGAQKKLEEVRDIGKRRELMLNQHGYSQRDMEPQYTCKLCNDTGYKSNTTCECVYDEMKRLRRIEVNQKGPLSLCRFENFSLEYYPDDMEGAPVSPRRTMMHIYEDCVGYAADFSVNSESLLMYGDAGLGKTHLALSIAADVLEKGFDVIYVSSQSAFAQVSAERFEGDSLFKSMLEADLLVLDDLGTEYMDAYTLGKLYELVNGRMNRRPTIYTTNICDDTLLYRRYTEKIASRLLGGCCPMRFWGQDLRLHKG